LGDQKKTAKTRNKTGLKKKKKGKKRGVHQLDVTTVKHLTRHERDQKGGPESGRVSVRERWGRGRNDGFSTHADYEGVEAGDLRRDKSDLVLGGRLGEMSRCDGRSINETSQKTFQNQRQEE